MPDLGFIKVNIHNTGRIPWLNIQGPRYNVSISPSIYRMLSEDPRVVIYPVDNDPIARAKIKEANDAKIAADAVKVEDSVVTAAEVTIEEEVVEEITEPDIIIEEGTEEEYVPMDTYDDQPIMQILEPDQDDLAIDKALEDLPEEDEDDFYTETETATETSGILAYSKDELLQLTKEQLKVILNKDRGFEPGTEFYGRYHDNHDVLVTKVLNSQ